jgi:hypothetical protein
VSFILRHHLRNGVASRGRDEQPADSLEKRLARRAYGGPGVELATLEDAARFIGLRQAWRQARPVVKRLGGSDIAARIWDRIEATRASSPCHTAA